MLLATLWNNATRNSCGCQHTGSNKLVSNFRALTRVQLVGIHVPNRIDSPRCDIHNFRLRLCLRRAILLARRLTYSSRRGKNIAVVNEAKFKIPRMSVLVQVFRGPPTRSAVHNTWTAGCYSEAEMDVSSDSARLCLKHDG